MTFIIEFQDGFAILDAAERLHQRGYRHLDAYTPFPVPDLEKYLVIRRTLLLFPVLLAGIAGAAVAFVVIWFTNGRSYPINVGGRPLNSFPTDIPIMFETAILLAGGTAFVLFFLLCGMPRLWDPSSEVEGIERTTIDRYWLLVRRSVFEETVADEMMKCGALAIRSIEGSL